MLETLIISTVFNTLPTIYPISIEESNCSSGHLKRKKKMKMNRTERVKKLSLEKAFPSLFAATAGLFGNMCCSSYSEQQVYEEARECEYNQEENSVLDMGTDSQYTEYPMPKKKASVEKINREYGFAGSPPPPKHKGAAARSRDPYSPIGSSYSTATTVTANTADDSWGALRSSPSLDREMSEVNLRESESDDDDETYSAFQDRTISVPSVSRSRLDLDLELTEDKRRWSESCAEYESRYEYEYPDVNGDVLPSEEVITIRKVQSESLAKLPYLSMTEGWNV
jgi:hypothetical protein